MRSLRILRWQMSTSVDSKVASSTNLAPRLGAWSRLGQPDAYALSLTLTRRQGAWGLRAPATCQQGCQFLSCGPTTGPTSLLPHSADHSQSWSSQRSKGGGGALHSASPWKEAQGMCGNLYYSIFFEHRLFLCLPDAKIPSLSLRNPQILIS